MKYTIVASLLASAQGSILDSFRGFDFGIQSPFTTNSYQWYYPDSTSRFWSSSFNRGSLYGNSQQYPTYYYPQYMYNNNGFNNNNRNLQKPLIPLNNQANPQIPNNNQLPANNGAPLTTSVPLNNVSPVNNNQVPSTQMINGAPANNNQLMYNPSLPPNTKVTLCMTQMAVHTSDSDNWLDQEEEWDMKIGIIGTSGNAVQTGQMNVPVKLQKANFMVNVNKCQDYEMSTDEAYQLTIYSDGVERDGGPNADDTIPGGQTTVNMNPNRPTPQKFAIKAGDSLHDYTIYGVVKYTPA
jgi:hypothetical protein